MKTKEELRNELVQLSAEMYDVMTTYQEEVKRLNARIKELEDGTVVPEQPTDLKDGKAFGLWRVTNHFLVARRFHEKWWLTQQVNTQDDSFVVRGSEMLKRGDVDAEQEFKTDAFIEKFAWVRSGLSGLYAPGQDVFPVPTGYKLSVAGDGTPIISKVEVQPELPFCKEGPRIDRIESVTKSSIRGIFHGVDVKELNFALILGGVEVARKNGFVPGSSNFEFNFGKDVTPGNYTFKIEGGLCKGEDSVIVTVPNEQNPEEPEEPGEPSNPQTNSGTMAKTDERFIKIVHAPHPSGKGFLISDIAPAKARSGYEFWWEINGMKPIKGQTLKDFHWKGDGVIGVIKHAYKIGLDTEHRWNLGGGGWYDPEAGYGEMYEQGVHTIGGQVEIVLSRDHTIPDWKPANNNAPQFSRLAPKMTLPKGKFMTFHVRSEIDKPSPKGRFDRGETHVNNWGAWEGVPKAKEADHTIGLQYMGVTGPRDANGKFNGDLSILEQAGERWGASGMMALETGEGVCWIDATGPHIQALMRGRKNRLIREGLWEEGGIMDCYGSMGWTGISLLSAQWADNPEAVYAKFKGLYSKDVAGVRNEFDLFRSNAEYITATNLKWYGHISERMGTPLDHIFQFEVSQRAGLKGIGYPGNITEIIDTQGYGGGFNWQIDLPGGGSQITTHLARPYWLHSFNFGFYSMWFGNGFYLWDAGGFVGDDPAYPEQWKGMPGWDTYFKDGGKPTAEPPAGVGRYPAVSMHMYDALYSGVEFYMQFKETEGGARRYVSHRLGDQLVTAEGDGSDAQKAYRNGHGIAQVRELNGKRTLMYFNPFLGNETRVLKVDGFKDHEIFGNKIYCFSE